jgi:hypothetical protein
MVDDYSKLQDEEFSRFMKKALSKVTARELSKHLRVPWPTLVRWADGTSAPFPRLRRMMVEATQEFLKRDED